MLSAKEIIGRPCLLRTPKPDVSDPLLDPLSVWRPPGPGPLPRTHPTGSDLFAGFDQAWAAFNEVHPDIGATRGDTCRMTSAGFRRGPACVPGELATCSREGFSTNAQFLWEAMRGRSYFIANRGARQSRATRRPTRILPTSSLRCPTKRPKRRPANSAHCHLRRANRALRAAALHLF